MVRLAFGECEPDDITFDLFEKLHRLDVRSVEGECLQIDPCNQSARITGNDFSGDIKYDFLIIALGRRLATEKIQGFFEHAHHMLGIREALELGEEVRTFERGDIVVGLSPDAFLPIPVCEAAFALARKFENEIERKEVSVTVVFIVISRSIPFTTLRRSSARFGASIKHSQERTALPPERYHRSVSF